MTLVQLTYVVAVDTHRHFGRAAEHCHVSQPTLSMQLQKLEEELGVELFDRSRKPVLPTDVGQRVIEQARVVLRECGRIQDLVAEKCGALSGTLHLGTIPTLSPYLLPLVTAPFSKQYPDVEVTVHEFPTEQLIDHLLTDRLDAGLIATEENRHGLILRALFSEPFVGYVGDEHRLATEDRLQTSDLDVSDLWLLSEGHCFREQVLHVCGRLEETGEANPIRFESGNLETLRLLVDRAGGMTLLPYLATLYLDSSGSQRIRPFLPPVPQRTVFLVHSRAYLKRALIEAYATVVRDTVGPVLTPVQGLER